MADQRPLVVVRLLLKEEVVLFVSLEVGLVVFVGLQVMIRRRHHAAVRRPNRLDHRRVGFRTEIKS